MQKTPQGFKYFPDFITPKEEIFLLEKIFLQTWEEVKMHGIVAKRRVVHFGLDYDYASRKAMAGNVIPDYLKPVIKRAATKMQIHENDCRNFNY